MAILSTCCFGAGASPSITIKTGDLVKSAPPKAESAPSVGLTIYSDNFAVVREARKMNFEKGQNTMRFTDVASAIDPTSVKFACLSSPGAVSVLEQNY
jgi:hypothetical protein